MMTDRNLYKYTPAYKRVWQSVRIYSTAETYHLQDLRDIHSIDIDAHTHEVLTIAMRCTKGPLRRPYSFSHRRTCR